MFINQTTGARKPELPVNTNTQTPDEAKAQWEAEGWSFPPDAEYSESAKAWVLRKDKKDDKVSEDDGAGQGE
jgi:hypothetical protein